MPSPPMTRRSLVGRALVVAVATALTGCTNRAVPPALVGRWEGGSHGNGPWYYEFAADGAYRVWPAASPGTVNAGTVAVDDTAITFSNGGAPVTSSWSLSGDRLLLDGQVYERVRISPP